MKIGLGVTTYNRDYLIKPLIEAIQKTILSDVVLIFSDDGSTDNTLNEIKFCNVSYISAPTKNIALNKNRALKYLYDQNCDYYFLIDDDLYPIKENWINYYIEAMNSTPIKHFIWAPPLWSTVIREEVYSGVSISRVNWPTGSLLCANKQVIDTVGAFSYNMKRYGFEHVDWSKRIARAGFLGNFDETYPHIKDSNEWFVYKSTYIPDSQTNIGVLEQEGDTNKMDYSMYNLSVMRQNILSGIICIPFQEQIIAQKYVVQ